MRPRPFIITTAAVALALTGVIAVVPTLYFVYRRPDIGLAVDCVAALVGSVAAYLVFQRFIRTRRAADLALAGALGVFGSTNLLFGVLPHLITSAGVARSGTGAVVVGRVVGAGLFTLSAFLSLDRRLPRALSTRRVVTVGIGTLVAIAGLGALLAVYAEIDPTLVDPALIPEASRRANPSFDLRILAVHVPAVFLHAAAAVGFTRRVENTGDGFLKWVAAGATLRAAASLNYFLFPALHAQYAYAADVFRLGFYVFLLVGAAKEMRTNWRDQELELLKTQFLANISHELRTPLVPILAYLPLLKNEELERSEVRSIVAEMEQAGQQLLRIMSLLVDYSSLQAGRIRVRQELVDLRRTIEPLVAQFADEADVRIVCHIDSDVPEVFANQKLLHQSVSELLDNARRFSPGEADIQLQVQARQGQVEIVVSDRGMGMSRETIGRIGRDFEQADASSTRAHGGLGLGLAFIRRIVEEMEGTLSVESEPGAGTTVTMSFPIGVRDAAPAPGESP